MQTLESLTLTYPFIVTVLLIHPHSLPDHFKKGGVHDWLLWVKKGIQSKLWLNVWNYQVDQYFLFKKVNEL